MANKPSIIDTKDIPMTESGKGDRFAARIGRLGQQLGMSKLGCTVVELDPGKRAWPYHEHYGQEELFVILEGTGTLRYDGGEYPVCAGQIIFTPCGKGTAHQIVNTSDRILKYLALSSMDNPEMCYYPDSGKYGCYHWDWHDESNRAVFLANEKSMIDYWEGEAGPD